MGSLSELESFWQQIPVQEHKAWSQRAQVCPCMYSDFITMPISCPANLAVAFALVAVAPITSEQTSTDRLV